MGRRGAARRGGTPRGPDGFERYYGELFGGRWPALRDALIDAGVSVPFGQGLLKPYYLDPASVVAALCLEVRPNHAVLDLCAAPGGKSLVLASGLRGDDGPDDPGGTLVCNERSSARRARLHRVLDAHLPAGLRERVRVTGHDAARWGLYEPAAYDRILADVPCSSEQHVIQSAGALEAWSASRSRRLAQGAYAIACAAVDAVRPGGRVVYSTCALSPLENDGVIERVIARGAATLRTVDPGPIVRRVAAAMDPATAACPGVATDRGWMILPDADDGMGPMYIAILERLEEERP